MTNQLLLPDAAATDKIYCNLSRARSGAADQEILEARRHVELLYSITKDLLDAKFSKQIKHDFSGSYAELYLAATLLDRLSLRVCHPSDHGPDFLVPSIRSWFEVIAISDGYPGNPNSLCAPVSGESYDHPEHKIILRLTNAFAAKSKKFRDDAKKCGSQILGSDPMVICIAAGHISEYPLRIAVGEYPHIVKSVLPVGHRVYWKDPQSGTVTDVEIPYRGTVEKCTSSGETSIETDFFLGNLHSHISAVIFMQPNAGNPICRNRWGCDFILVHNPNAKNKLPYGTLRCGIEYAPKISETKIEIEPPINHNGGG